MAPPTMSFSRNWEGTSRLCLQSANRWQVFRAQGVLLPINRRDLGHDGRGIHVYYSSKVDAKLVEAQCLPFHTECRAYARLVSKRPRKSIWQSAATGSSISPMLRKMESKSNLALKPGGTIVGIWTHPIRRLSKLPVLMLTARQIHNEQVARKDLIT